MTTQSSPISGSLLVFAHGETSIEPVPEGLHPAVCVSLYDVGTLFNERFDTAQRKLIVTWELPSLPPLEVERDGQKQKLPRCLSRRFTMSLNEKANLRHVLESWRGRKFTEQELAGFDAVKLLGQPCHIQVMHETGREGRVFANVANVLPMPHGTSVQGSSKTMLFSVSTLVKPELPAELPEWIAKLVKESREWERLTKKTNNWVPPGPPTTAEASPVTEPTSDDVPF